MKKNRRIKLILLSTIGLLLVPFIAMQFTDEVRWAPLDFVIAGLLLFGTGLFIELVLRKTKKFNFRMIAIIAIVALFLLVWAELAVGILGTPFAGS
ncbi:MAG: hypothetical protein AAF489_08025 [Bacteroidota bacterium]